jgi:hypothetical protein
METNMTATIFFNRPPKTPAPILGHFYTNQNKHFTHLHVLRFINKLNYIVKCRIQSRYFVRKRKEKKNFRHIHSPTKMQPLSPTCTHAITLEYQGELQGEKMTLIRTDHQNIQFRMILFFK